MLKRLFTVPFAKVLGGSDKDSISIDQIRERHELVEARRQVENSQRSAIDLASAPIPQRILRLMLKSTKPNMEIYYQGYLSCPPRPADVGVEDWIKRWFAAHGLKAFYVERAEPSFWSIELL